MWDTQWTSNNPLQWYFLWVIQFSTRIGTKLFISDLFRFKATHRKEEDEAINFDLRLIFFWVRHHLWVAVHFISKAIFLHLNVSASTISFFFNERRLLGGKKRTSTRKNSPIIFLLLVTFTQYYFKMPTSYVFQRFFSSLGVLARDFSFNFWIFNKFAIQIPTRANPISTMTQLGLMG